MAISIDSSKPEVMRRGRDGRRRIINDIKALGAAGAREWAAATKVGVCLMHMRGEPRTMQDAPDYQDVVSEVGAFCASAPRVLRPAWPPRPLCSIRARFREGPATTCQLLKHLAT